MGGSQQPTFLETEYKQKALPLAAAAKSRSIHCPRPFDFFGLFAMMYTTLRFKGLAPFLFFFEGSASRRA